MGAEFGTSYSEFLEVVINPSAKKFRKRYKGKTSPAPVLKADALLIKRFLDEATIDGLGAGAAKTSASYLAGISRKFPDLQKMDTTRAGAAFSDIRQSMKPNSGRRAMGILKQFIRWMNEKNINTKIDLTRLLKIKLPKPDFTTKRASDMLSGKEITQLIEAAGNDRDRALIAMIFEGSLRPIEASAAVWGDLNFDKYGCQFTTSKKTGKPRYIRLIMAAPYLLKMKNNYPLPLTNDSPLFVSFKSPHQALSRGGIYVVFMDILKKSGITKKISPYYLRHSRITAMSRDQIPDNIIKLQAWGSQRSNMLGTYSHLVNSDMDSVLLTRAGIITEDEKNKDESLKPRQCPHCGKVHTPTTRFCDECGAGLTKEAIESRDSTMNELIRLLKTLPPEKQAEVSKNL